MSPRPVVSWVRVTGQSAGAEKRNPANVAERHDDGTDGAEPDARATARGERHRVSTIRRAIGPLAVTSTRREGA